MSWAEGVEARFRAVAGVEGMPELIPDWLITAGPILGVLGVIVSILLGLQVLGRTRPSRKRTPRRLPSVGPSADDVGAVREELAEVEASAEPAPEPTDPDALSEDEVDDEVFTR